MHFKSFIIIPAAAMVWCSCSKQSTEPAVPSTQTPAIQTTLASTISFTDKSSFVSSLSSYGFKTPDQLSLNRVASTSGYTAAVTAGRMVRKTCTLIQLRVICGTLRNMKHKSMVRTTVVCLR